MKHLSGTIVRKSNLGARQIFVTASTEIRDRQNDIMSMSGCDLTFYKSNPVVLANHDPLAPIGNAAPFIVNGKLQATITFAPEGASKTADEYCALAKAGVISAISIGFEPTDWELLSGGGCRYTSWTLLEISLVAVPANPEATIVQRSYRPAARANRFADISRLSEIGKQYERDEARSIATAPTSADYVHLMREKMEREQLAAHAATRESDPFVLRQKRVCEIEALRRE
ncbi:MAG: hypothetical protein EKK29_05820 [Hyphomicrobiales bacterium]|nr:MAG: hypothetical protein EKK29_05820 [Hyphomicrobiales bacterium]